MVDGKWKAEALFTSAILHFAFSIARAERYRL
jgi:hypothetical protein